MKILISIVFLFASFLSFAQNNANYVIILNNDSVFINLDETKHYTTKSGENIKVELVQPKILTYADNMISFKYESSLNVSNTQLDEGIEQCLLMKSTGNGFLVQKYSTIDPSSMTEFMITELTKESIGYGYQRTDENFEKKLLSGETLKGLKVTLSFEDEKQVYTVATYGENDHGILVLTMYLNSDYDDMEIINLFLNTLQLKK